MDQVRDALRRRGDVDPDDIDDLVGIAAELQDADRGKATVDEVRAVASELDVDPAYVAQAIEVLKGRRAEDQARAEARAASRSRALVLGGGALAAVGGALFVILALLGVSGGASLRAADAEVQRTEQALDAVLDRQERLVPQLVGLAGGSTTFRDVPDDGPMDARLAASAELAKELAAALAALPPAAGDAAGQQRLELQYELTGAENRIATERMRWEAARAARDAVVASPSGRVARWLPF